MFRAELQAHRAADKIKRFASFFMILLVISIPIHAARVLAYSGTLSNLQYGADKVLEDTDSLNVSVVAKIVDQGVPIPLNENNVRLKYSGFEYKFNRCTKSGDSYLCTYSSGVRDWDSGRYELEVQLYDNYFMLLDTEKGNFYIDAEAPKIDELTLTEGEDGLVLNLKASDTACPGCTGYCAGIDYAELYYDGELVETIELSGCDSEHEFLVPFGAEGSTEICVVVYDKTGLSVETCRNAFVDYTAPQFGNAYMTAGGIPVDFSSMFPFAAVLTVEISDETSGVTSATADLSSLNTVNPEVYKSVQGNCAYVDEATVNCSFDVTIDKVDGSASVLVEAVDEKSNTGSKTYTFNLPLDSAKPLVTDISSGLDSTYLKRDENTIKVTITESGSGMYHGECYLDLHALGLGSNVKADHCESEAEWECFFEGIVVVGASDNDSLIVRVNRVIDDAGSFMDEDGLSQQTFLYDATPPKFLNITLKPLGTDIEIIREGDIVEISAEIFEEGGLQASNVYADYSDLDSSNNYTNAETCELTEESVWLCLWQYSGPIDAGHQIVLDVTATDDAGNMKKSTDDGVNGKVYAADVIERDVDFWENDAENFSVSKLNRNFLWMSSTGTYIRAGVRLVPKASPSHVHGFEITLCDGTLVSSGGNDSFEPFTIKEQLYYPGVPRSDKYLILNIPNFDKDLVEAAGSVKIVCQAEVIQSNTAKSSVFSPNEKVNMTIDVTLTDSIFSTPDLTAIDQITEKEKLMKKIEKWIDMIEKWVDFLQPICSLISLVRQLIDGICMLLNVLAAPSLGILESASQSCFLKFEMVETLWYGSDGKQTNSASTKNEFSVGFICDLVLCEECSLFWKKKIFSGADEWTSGLKLDLWGYKNADSGTANYAGITSQEQAQGLGTYDPVINFDPQQSLVTAIICWPPCLTGILSKLQVYKQIIITYNACVNVRAIRGESISLCDEFWSSQVCQQILGEFWYIIDNFFKDYISKFILYVFEQKVLRLSECNPTCKTDKTCQFPCLMKSMYRIVGWFLQLTTTLDNLDKIKEHEYFDKDSEDAQDDAEDSIS